MTSIDTDEAFFLSRLNDDIYVVDRLATALRNWKFYVTDHIDDTEALMWRDTAHLRAKEAIKNLVHYI